MAATDQSGAGWTGGTTPGRRYPKPCAWSLITACRRDDGLSRWAGRGSGHHIPHYRRWAVTGQLGRLPHAQLRSVMELLRGYCPRALTGRWTERPASALSWLGRGLVGVARGPVVAGDLAAGDGDGRCRGETVAPDRV